MERDLYRPSSLITTLNYKLGMEPAGLYVKSHTILVQMTHKISCMLFVAGGWPGHTNKTPVWWTMPVGRGHAPCGVMGQLQQQAEDWRRTTRLYTASVKQYPDRITEHKTSQDKIPQHHKWTKSHKMKSGQNPTTWKVDKIPQHENWTKSNHNMKSKQIKSNILK